VPSNQPMNLTVPAGGHGGMIDGLVRAAVPQVIGMTSGRHMKAYVTRDSVAAGDDVDAPHARTLELPDVGDVRALVTAVKGGYPLPGISGGKATWVLSSGTPLAVVAQQWARHRLVCWKAMRISELDVNAGVLGLHFSYLAQIPPEQAVDVLRRLRLRALR
jgi:hypothetical protein